MSRRVGSGAASQALVSEHLRLQKSVFLGALRSEAAGAAAGQARAATGQARAAAGQARAAEELLLELEGSRPGSKARAAPGRAAAEADRRRAERRAEFDAMLEADERESSRDLSEAKPPQLRARLAKRAGSKAASLLKLLRRSELTPQQKQQARRRRKRVVKELVL